MQAVAFFSGLAFKAHHGDFLNKRRLHVVCFDLFGIDVFSVAEDDDFLLAPSKEEISFGVEVSEVAGEEPSIFHDSCSGVGPVPVTFHHERAAHREFADIGATVLLRLRIDDLALDALHRRAAGTDYDVVG